MAVFFTMSTLDRFAKRTSMQIEVNPAATDPQLQALVDAIDPIILGSAARGTKTEATVIDSGSAVKPNDVNATRFRKWLIGMHDVVEDKILTYEIGTADADQLPAGDADTLDLTAGVGLAVKTAIEAVYRSPYGNGGTLAYIQEVSRTGKQ